MRSPVLPSIRLSILLALLSLLPPSGALRAEERFDFAEAPLGAWDLAGQAPLMSVSHPSVTLQIQEAEEGPNGGPAHVLELKGDHRGFRNVKDFTPPLTTEGVIRFDLRVKSGGLLLTAFESSQNKETRSRGIKLLFHVTGAVESYFGTPGVDSTPTRHTRYKRGIWYRTELRIRMSGKGGGTYSVRITDLSTGAELPLTNATDLPIDAKVLSIGGWDFNLARANSEMELDGLTFSPEPHEGTP